MNSEEVFTTCQHAQADFSSHAIGARVRIEQRIRANPYTAQLDRVLPFELWTAQQWVIGRLKRGKDGRVGMIPQVCGHNADATDPARWKTFETAAFGVPADGGLQFVLPPDRSICCIDLDNALSPLTGEIHADVAPLVALCIQIGAYVEISRSGRGLHIFVRGQKPGDRVRSSSRPGIEIFDCLKPIHMTGNMLPGSNGRGRLADGQAIIDLLYGELFPAGENGQAGEWQDHTEGCGCGGCSPRTAARFPGIAVMLEKISASNMKRKEVFSRLWKGDTSDFAGDDSAADLALCNFLRFWCGLDPAIIDAAFRASGLYRDKWDRDDYRDSTITKALAGKTEAYDWSRWAEKQARREQAALPGSYQSGNSESSLSVSSGTQDDDRPELTKGTSAPVIGDYTCPCRRVRRKFIHLEDSRKRMIGGFACRLREKCNECRDFWMKRSADWCEGVMVQWLEIHLEDVSTKREAAAVTQQLKRRAEAEDALGDDGIKVQRYAITQRDGRTVIFSNVSTTNSKPLTQDQMVNELANALKNIKAKSRIHGTKAILPPPIVVRKPSKKWALDKVQPPLSGDRTDESQILTALYARDIKPFVRDWEEGHARFIVYRVPETFTDRDADRLDEEMVPGYIAKPREGAIQRHSCKPPNERRQHVRVMMLRE